MLTSKKKIDYRSLSNDLFADFFCYCNGEVTGDTEIIKLQGYNDANFFDNVNAKPSEIKCPNCGQIYEYQWFRDGVIIEKKGDDEVETRG